MVRSIFTVRCLAYAVVVAAATVARADDALSRLEPAADRTDAGLPYVPPAWPDAPDTAAMLRRLVLGTVAVLGLCVSTLVVARRWLRGVPVGARPGSQLQLAESIALGNRCSLFLVLVAGQRILVGTDAAGLKSVVALPVPFEQALSEAEPVEEASVAAGAAGASSAPAHHAVLAS